MLLGHCGYRWKPNGCFLADRRWPVNRIKKALSNHISLNKRINSLVGNIVNLSRFIKRFLQAFSMRKHLPLPHHFIYLIVVLNFSCFQRTLKFLSETRVLLHCDFRTRFVFGLIERTFYFKLSYSLI